MPVEVMLKKPPSKSTFPLEKVRELVRRELEEAAEESETLHDGWEPVLDSLRVVTIISGLEDIIDCPLPPEKVVRKGGYTSVDEAEEDVIDNIRRLWEKHYS